MSPACSDASPASVSDVGVSALEGTGGPVFLFHCWSCSQLCPVPQGAHPQQPGPPGSHRKGWSGQEVSCAHFWKGTFTYGLSKVYIFSFLYQGFTGLGGVRGCRTAYFLGEYVWQIVLQLCFRREKNLRQYREGTGASSVLWLHLSRGAAVKEGGF